MMLIALATPPTAKMVKAIANGAHLSSTSKPGISSRGITAPRDRKSTRLNSSHMSISYAVFCLTKKKRAGAAHPACAADGFQQRRDADSARQLRPAGGSHGPQADWRELVERGFLFFFFNDTATTEIYTLSLHDALPI